MKPNSSIVLGLLVIYVFVVVDAKRRLAVNVNTLDTRDFVSGDEDQNSPLQPCQRVNSDFYRCVLADITGKSESEIRDNDLIGCRSYSGFKTEKTKTGTASCTVLDGIECSGNRTFLMDNVPCVKYSEKKYPTALLLSVFLGWVGADRIYLDYALMGSFKLLTLGGLGIWWLVDTCLLLAGQYDPYNGHTWDPHP
eukprot:TRINITY_DN2574_c0_g1_i2.p1 TRINITY_DN2574_c0_g1~~TRINITY_DN2574_c0_g1_i2.p1  ORF type:complete len:195 (-),score=20.95 TRINITY_DN2574_c0_g1_i2:122-706(-)